MMSDFDVETLISELDKVIDGREYNTVLLQDVDDGEYYVIKDEIIIDEDNDVIIKIKRL